MKILVIGMGGIGSWLLEEICACIGQGQIDSMIEFVIADADIAELEQLNYQNFKRSEAGMNKSEALALRFQEYGIKEYTSRIERNEQLREYDTIILCVDNEKCRELVVKHCHKHNKEFLDLRATGRRIFAMPKADSLEQNLKFIDSDDTEEYSCQDKADLDKGWVQNGNKVVAALGVQILLNLLRGHKNRVINLSI